MSGRVPPRLLLHPFGFLSLGFGSGLVPAAPGTAGTLPQFLSTCIHSTFSLYDKVLHRPVELAGELRLSIRNQQIFMLKDRTQIRHSCIHQHLVKYSCWVYSRLNQPI